MRPLVWMLAGVLILSAPLAIQAKEKESESKAKAAGTSETISYATYQQRTGRVEVVVGSEIASLAWKEKFLPLQIAVGVWDRGPELKVAAERFLLIDPKENLLNPVPLDTFENKEYMGILESARAFNEQNPLQTGDDFSLSHLVASNFYPDEPGAFYTVANLDRDTYLRDILLFPQPEGGLSGILTLQFLTPGMDKPVEVKFEIPTDPKEHHEE